MKDYLEFKVTRPVVCVQGLGFVGTAMAVAVADAKDDSGQPRFNVIGVELPNLDGCRKVEAINCGQLPVISTDEQLQEAMQRAHKQGNFIATTSFDAYQYASVVLVSIHLDVQRHADGSAGVDFTGFRKAIHTLGENIPSGCLVIVETTVPPGTCEKVVAPELSQAFFNRGMTDQDFFLSHSYERVMPGKDYYNSIVNFWRVYSGHTLEAADRCEAFLSKVINVDEYPLVRVDCTAASEISKVLENSYRATNIAFIEEWARFSEQVGVNLFEVIDAIRMRPTHSNIRQPGFGVGGYCLTKDPLLGAIAARDIFHLDEASFPFSTMSVRVNEQMPLATLNMLRGMLGDFKGKRILLLGVSYRQDVGDTRYSPAEIFVRHVLKQGARITCHDPLVQHWEEMDMDVLNGAVPEFDGFDAVVFAVQHIEYADLDMAKVLKGCSTALLDANCVLTPVQYDDASKITHNFRSIGRGD